MAKRAILLSKSGELVEVHDITRGWWPPRITVTGKRYSRVPVDGLDQETDDADYNAVFVESGLDPDGVHALAAQYVRDNPPTQSGPEVQLGSWPLNNSLRNRFVWSIRLSKQQQDSSRHSATWRSTQEYWGAARFSICKTTAANRGLRSRQGKE